MKVTNALRQSIITKTVLFAHLPNPVKLRVGAIVNDRFVGIYRTVWLEDAGHVPAELKIECHPLNMFYIN